MDTKIIEERIQELEKQVYSYSGMKTPLIYSVKNNLKNIYISAPIIVFIFLLIFRPQFIYKESIDRKGNIINRHICLKFFLLTWIFITIFIYVCFFILNFKKL